VIKLNNLTIDSVICLHLPGRECFPLLLKDADQLDISIQIYSPEISGISDQPIISWINCLNCHKQIMAYCLRQNYKNVLLLEDDACLTNDFYDILSKIEFPDNFFSVHLGGYCRSDINGGYDTNQSYEEVSNPYFRDIVYMSGFFGVILNCRAFLAFQNTTAMQPMDKCIDTELPNHGKYYLVPPIILERNVDSAIDSQIVERGQYDQALREGRVFTYDDS